MVLISNLRTDEKMKDIYIKDKFNRDIAAIEFESPIHDKVIMSKHNYFTHIISSHPEINLEIIQSVAETPDKIFEVLKKDRLFYYEKAIDNKIYIVVMGEKAKGQCKKVITAFQLTDYNKNRFNRVHCIYDKEDVEDTEEQLIEQLMEDKEYFDKLFDS